jgi:hypothetical protein
VTSIEVTTVVGCLAVTVTVSCGCGSSAITTGGVMASLIAGYRSRVFVGISRLLFVFSLAAISLLLL